MTMNLPADPPPGPESAAMGLATVTSQPLGEASALAPGMLPAGKPRSAFRRSLDVFLENKLAVTGVAIFVAMVLFCFLGPLFYHTDQVHTNLSQVLCPPSGSHLLGCDNVGYDQLGRLMVGGQTSLEVGVAAAVVAVLFGTLYGAISGFIGGVVDSFLMRLVDAGLSIPYITLVIIL